VSELDLCDELLKGWRLKWGFGRMFAEREEVLKLRARRRELLMHLADVSLWLKDRKGSFRLQRLEESHASTLLLAPGRDWLKMGVVTGCVAAIVLTAYGGRGTLKRLGESVVELVLHTYGRLKDQIASIISTMKRDRQFVVVAPGRCLLLFYLLELFL
jgi:hypothetical protein